MCLLRLLNLLVFVALLLHIAWSTSVGLLSLACFSLLSGLVLPFDCWLARCATAHCATAVRDCILAKVLLLLLELCRQAVACSNNTLVMPKIIENQYLIFEIKW